MVASSTDVSCKPSLLSHWQLLLMAHYEILNADAAASTCRPLSATSTAGCQPPAGKPRSRPSMPDN